MEYIDDLIFQFQPHLTHLVAPVLEKALASVNLRLSHGKSKVIIPSVVDGQVHPSFEEFGLPQVFQNMELLGGAMDGEFASDFRGAPSTSVPRASMKRLVEAEALSEKLIQMIDTPLSRASHRAIWTLVDKVLNKTLDYDARILKPEIFSTLAIRLDIAVRRVLLKLVHVVDFDANEERCLRLHFEKGGCGITSAKQKALYAHLAAACQYMPSVTKMLLEMGWSKESIEGAIDLSGVHSCLNSLSDVGIYIASDGTI